MNIWERQDKEPKKYYDGFVYYLEHPHDRNNNKVLSKIVGKDTSYISIIKSRYDWVERAEAYDRYMEQETSKKRSMMIKESAYRLNKDMIDYIKLLTTIPNIYKEKLFKPESIEELRSMNILDLRRYTNEDLDTIIKIGKVYKEFLSLLPEGREVLEEEQKGDKITIVFNSVSNGEQKVIDITQNKKEITYEEEKEKI